LATGKAGDRTLRHEVRPYTRVWSQANMSSSRPTRELVLAIRESAPFALHFAPERLEVKSGKKAEVKLHADRLWPDFKNTMTVSPLAFPGSIRMNNVEIAADKNEISIPIEVQPGTRPGE